MFISITAKWLEYWISAYLLISCHNSLQRGFGKSGTIWAPISFCKTLHAYHLRSIPFRPFQCNFWKSKHRKRVPSSVRAFPNSCCYLSLNMDKQDTKRYNNKKMKGVPANGSITGNQCFGFIQSLIRIDCMKRWNISERDFALKPQKLF